MAPRLHNCALSFSRVSQQLSRIRTSPHHCSFSTTPAYLKLQRTTYLKVLKKTPARLKGLKEDIPRFEKRKPELPPQYPYGPSRFYKQRDTGLYGDVTVQFGNNVGPKSAVKSRRRWLPNINHRKLYSAALDKMITLKVATRVQRTIHKVGGLDNYLLGSTSARLKELGLEGWGLRWAIMQTLNVKQRLAKEPALKDIRDYVHNSALARWKYGASPESWTWSGPFKQRNPPLRQRLFKDDPPTRRIALPKQKRSDTVAAVTKMTVGASEDPNLTALEERIQQNFSSEPSPERPAQGTSLMQRFISPITRVFRR